MKPKKKWYSVVDPLDDTTHKFATLHEAYVFFDALLLKQEPPPDWEVHTLLPLPYFRRVEIGVPL